jgi:hypothetical protein
MVLIVESSALQAVASAACLAKSVTPQAVKELASASTAKVIRILMDKFSLISSTISY